MFEAFELDAPLDEELTIPIVQLEEGQPDPRFLRVSYSSELDLHACPRYFQLSKLQAPKQGDFSSNVTFAYGQAVGEGIQEYLIHKNLDKALWVMYTKWEVGLFDENEKQAKSFFHAVAALMQFDGLCKDGLLSEYEVVWFNGKPAAELSFRIHFPNSTYRGFIDLVLRHVITGELLILELKTSSANYINHYQYKNSAQAIGYSVILDKIAPGTTAYSVLYLVQLTKLGKYEVFEFPKTYHQRSLWVKDRIWDEGIIMNLIKFYGNYGVWPTHGESCTRFGKTCEYMDSCHLQTEHLMAPLRENMLTEETVYDFEFTVEELLS